MANRMTEKLIRRKAEHHDGIIGDMEELSLHQCELGGIETVGTLCRKLKILLLQNNVIPKMENLEHLKDLQYLNLALNNISKIEGLQRCEFLRKLDLTVNFIDMDEFETSVSHLSHLHHLEELFLMGNPCTEWEGHKAYLIARVPQLQRFDGKEIIRSERILAAQQLPELRRQLRKLAAAKREEKGLPARKPVPDHIDDEDACEWSPETRVAIAVEQAEQKRKEDERKAEMSAPERNYEAEHRAKYEKVKEAEATATKEKPLRQCNEARVDFHMEEEDGKGNVTLRIPLSKFLDNSLLDVDVHPFHITVLIKGKVLRLSLPEEVKSDASKAQRSRTTGELLVVMPKENPNPRMVRRLREMRERDEEEAKKTKEAARAARRAKAPKKMADEMMRAVESKAVSVKGIVKGAPTEAGMDMKARSTTRAAAAAGAAESKGADGEESEDSDDVEMTPATTAAMAATGDDDESDWEDDGDVPPLM